jgi:hypothetical protein
MMLLGRVTCAGWRCVTDGHAQEQIRPSETGGVFAAYPELARTMPSSEADLAKLYSPNWSVYNANLARATDYRNRDVKH